MIIVNRPLPARTGFVQQTFDAILQEPPPPLAHGAFMHPELCRDGLAGNAICTSKNDAAPLGHRARHTASANRSLEIDPLIQLSTNGAVGRPVAFAMDPLPQLSGTTSYNEPNFRYRSLDSINHPPAVFVAPKKPHPPNVERPDCERRRQDHGGYGRRSRAP